MNNMNGGLNFSLARKTGKEFLLLTMISEKYSVLIRFMSLHNEKSFTYQSQGIYI